MLLFTFLDTLLELAKDAKVKTTSRYTGNDFKQLNEEGQITTETTTSPHHEVKLSLLTRPKGHQLVSNLIRIFQEPDEFVFPRSGSEYKIMSELLSNDKISAGAISSQHRDLSTNSIEALTKSSERSRDSPKRKISPFPFKGGLLSPGVKPIGHRPSVDPSQSYIAHIQNRIDDLSE